MDCEEIKAKIEEYVFDGHRIEEVLAHIQAGNVSKTEFQWWIRGKMAELRENCPWLNMTEEEKEAKYEEFKVTSFHLTLL